MHKNYLPLLGILLTIAIFVGSFAFYKSLSAPTPPSQIAMVSLPPLPSPTGKTIQILGASESAHKKIPLSISSPLEEASISSSLLSVSGKTASDAAITINDKTTTTSDSDGFFKTSIHLVAGANLVVIQASSSAGQAVWQTVVTFIPKNIIPPAQTPTNAP